MSRAEGQCRRTLPNHVSFIACLLQFLRKHGIRQIGSLQRPKVRKVRLRGCKVEWEPTGEETCSGRSANLVSVKTINLQSAAGKSIDCRCVDFWVVVTHTVPAEIILRTQAWQNP